MIDDERGERTMRAAVAQGSSSPRTRDIFFDGLTTSPRYLRAKSIGPSGFDIAVGGIALSAAREESETDR